MSSSMDGHAGLPPLNAAPDDGWYWVDQPWVGQNIAELQGGLWFLTGHFHPQPFHAVKIISPRLLPPTRDAP